MCICQNYFPLHFCETQKSGFITHLWQLLFRPKEDGRSGVQKVSWSPYSLLNHPSTLPCPDVLSPQPQKVYLAASSSKEVQIETFQIGWPTCPHLPGTFLVLAQKVPHSGKPVSPGKTAWLITLRLDPFSALPLHSLYSACLQGSRGERSVSIWPSRPVGTVSCKIHSEHCIYTLSPLWYHPATPETQSSCLTTYMYFKHTKGKTV